MKAIVDRQTLENCENLRLEALINCYLYEQSSSQIQENKISLMRQMDEKIDQIKDLEMKNINLAVDILGMQIIQQLELFLGGTQEESQVILDKCQIVDKLFTQFSEFLFMNLKRVLLGENILIDIGLFKGQIAVIFDKLKVLGVTYGQKLENLDEYFSGLKEIVDLSLAEVDMIKDIITLMEKKGILEKLVEFKNQAMEAERKKLVEGLLG